MRSVRFMGLVFTSLLLTACWLSSLPASEHPWDEDEIVQCDTSSGMSGDGANRYIGTSDICVVVLPVPELLSGFPGIRIVIVSRAENGNVNRSQSALRGDERPAGRRIVLLSGRESRIKR